MTVTSLFAITNNLLTIRRYPIHYFLEFIIHCKEAIRNLAIGGEIDTLRMKLLPLNEFNEVILPNDFVDEVRICVRDGQYLRPLVKDEGINAMPNYDSDFQQQLYANNPPDASNTSASVYFNGYSAAYWWLNNYNSFGENTGRFFGGVGQMNDTYRVIKSRNIIKINENLDVNKIVLEYVGNGMDADSATHIDVQAQSTIQAFALWQFFLHNRTYSMGEAELMEQKYIQERKILRALKFGMSLNDLIRAVQKNSIGVKY